MNISPTRSVTPAATSYPEFRPRPYTIEHHHPATTTPAKYPLGSRHDPLYIGSSAMVINWPTPNRPEGLRYAGRNFNDALAAARLLSTTPIARTDPPSDVTTTAAVFRTKSGAYLISTVWVDDFHSDVLRPMPLDALAGLKTKRSDLVALAGPDGWLQRIDPA